MCKAEGRTRPFTQLDKVADAGLALGVINQTEADLLRRAEESRLRTINVDDFDPIDLVANKALFEASAYHRAA
ncbi:Acyl-coenzyme A dehydrogenase [compost metagenome]